MGNKGGQARRQPRGNFRTRQREQQAQAAAAQREEDRRLARMRKEVPSPEEMDAVLKRIRKTASITFEVELGSWRAVYLTEPIPMPNKHKPELSIIFFKPVLVISTPFMPELRGYVACTLESLYTKRGTYMEGAEGVEIHQLTAGMRHGRTVGFRPANSDSADWYRLCFARCMGYQFREHDSLDPTKVVYTARP